MFEHDPDDPSIKRVVFLDRADTPPLDESIKTFLREARERGLTRVNLMTHTEDGFRSLSGHPRLRPLRDAMVARRPHKVGNLLITGGTSRRHPGSHREAVLMLWPDDARLLQSERDGYTFVGAILSSVERAPIWLGAHDIVVPEHEPDEPWIGRESVHPVDRLGWLIEEFDRNNPINLNNGMYDSTGDRIKNTVRQAVRRGGATREEVGVAAIRSGWHSDKVMALVEYAVK